MGIGNIALPFRIEFPSHQRGRKLTNGRIRALDYDSLSTLNFSRKEPTRHKKIVTKSAARAKSKRKKRPSELNRSFAVQKGTPLSKKKIMNILRGNHHSFNVGPNLNATVTGREVSP